MFKFDLWDLLWLVGLIAANVLFFAGNSEWYHYFILNFVAVITMLVVGSSRYELSKIRKEKE